MALTDDFLTHFTELMTKSTETSTPYSNTIQYIKDSFDDYNITDKEKAELIINYMIQSTTQITATAMQMSLQAVEREVKLPLEAEALAIQNATLELEQDRIALEKTKMQYEVDYLLPLEKDKLTQEKLVLEQQVAEFTYKIANIFPKELEKMEEEIDLLQSQDADVIAKTAIAQAQSAKDIELKTAQIVGIGHDNSVKAEQVTMSAFEREFIQPKNLEKITAEVSLMGKDEDVKDAQILGITKDNAVKDEQILMSTYERTTLQPKQLEKIDAEITAMEADGTVKAKQALLIQEQVESEAMQNMEDGVIAKQIEGIVQDNLFKAEQITLAQKDVEVKTAQISGITKDNLVKDQQIAESTYRVENILPKELEKATAEITLMGKDGSLKDGQILGITKDNEVKDAQITKIGKENLLIQAEVDIKTDADVIQAQKDTLVNTATKIEKESTVLEKQALDIVAKTTIAETQSAKDVELKTAQITSIGKDDLVKEKQIDNLTSQIDVRDAQSVKDLLIKDAQKDIYVQQKATEEKRTAQVEQVVAEATAKQPYNVINVQKQGSLLDAQTSKQEADIHLTLSQESALTQQVIDNRKIKMIENMGETFSNMAMGSLVVSADMWSTYFSKLNDLDTISIPASTAVTKVV